MLIWHVLKRPKLLEDMSEVLVALLYRPRSSSDDLNRIVWYRVDAAGILEYDIPQMCVLGDSIPVAGFDDVWLNDFYPNLYSE